MRALLLWVVLLSLLSATVFAMPPANAERRLRRVIQEAARLLDKAEYQRAREMLEAARRSEEAQKASRRTRARLYAYLGRARAELGDFAGMGDAFERAVELDKKVRLSPKKTSPKILKALEEARALVAAEEPEPAPARKPRKKKAKKQKKPAEIAPPKVAAKPTHPELRYRLAGEPVEYARVRAILELVDIPDDAEIYAHVRRHAGDMFTSAQMTRTGTIASIELKLERENVDLYFEAKRGTEVISRLASSDAPITVSIVLPPTILNAWGQDQIGTSSTSSVAAAPVVEETSEAPDELAWALAGASVLVGVAIFLIVVSAGHSACTAEPGYGCTEVRILPLSLP